jgi:hypothetical protein
MSRVQFYHHIVDVFLAYVFLPMRQLWILLRTQNSHRTVTKNSKSEKPQDGEPVDQSNLDRRHRLKNGRIARKFGNTYIRTLRVKYGPGFAPNEQADSKLIAVLHQLDDRSLRKLVETLSKNQRSEKSPVPPPSD